MDSRIVYRWLAHHEYIEANFDFQQLEEGARIIVVARRPILAAGSSAAPDCATKTLETMR
jgi:hypothetical protein